MDDSDAIDIAIFLNETKENIKIFNIGIKYNLIIKIKLKKLIK